MFVRCLVIVDAKRGEMTIGRHGERYSTKSAVGKMNNMTETLFNSLDKVEIFVVAKIKKVRQSTTDH
jgi:hypothetical protein